MYDTKPFVVKIKLPDEIHNGKTIQSTQIANTKWQAIDKAYSEFCKLQPNRSKYKMVKIK